MTARDAGLAGGAVSARVRRALNLMNPSVRVGWYTGPREPNGCRLWLGSLSTGGYPSIGVDGLATRVGRFLLGLKAGDPRVAMHRCDGPACVEPTHLRIGTQRENNADKKFKGRVNAAKGDRVSGAKLTPALVRWARTEHANGKSQLAIASALGVTRTPVALLLQRKTWKHVD